jgi:imidazolonepropionase-like amidohydrolase
MAGTDALGFPFGIPGTSLHKELRLLEESGFTHFEVLQAATTVPSKFIGEEKEFGTIAPGMRADLLLVEGNPLEDLAYLVRPLGVMVRGIWLPRAKLDEMLASLD